MGSLLDVVVISALFHVITPKNIGKVVLGFVLGMAAMMALGSLVSARVARLDRHGHRQHHLLPATPHRRRFTVIEPGTVLYQIAQQYCDSGR